VLLSGIGAMTAVILLIFKDTILSFVAGIQITGYDLIHVGDWIEMPEYGADGDVIDIALHTVKVQNWDKTITVIPTHKLTENSFKNWRGMQQAGGRRIKRALYIDQNSVSACNDEMIERFSKINLIADYVQKKKEELEKHNRENKIDSSVKVNRRQMTNIGTFRAYAQAYLEKHSKINHSLTTMVRQLPPGPNGLPMEVYAFTNTTEWLAYESIQGDIFDHLLSVVPEFDLHIFQNPAGMDFRKLASGN
jgi:miniconductance mechanosensitive channel